MTERQSDILDDALVSFLTNSKWNEGTDTIQSLVKGNLNGFVAHLRECLLFSGDTRLVGPGQFSRTLLLTTDTEAKPKVTKLSEETVQRVETTLRRQVCSSYHSVAFRGPCSNCGHPRSEHTMLDVALTPRCNCGACCGENRYHDMGDECCQFDKDGTRRMRVRAVDIGVVDPVLKKTIIEVVNQAIKDGNIR